jgi:hypothetical protein
MTAVSATSIETVSGAFIDLLNPLPEQVVPEDIGWALSRIPRYAGHTITPHAYTVGQHSVFTVELVKELIHGDNHRLNESFAKFSGGMLFSKSDVEDSCALLYVLLHDASEAYILDIPTPIKKGLPGIKEHYGALEARVMKVIWERFGLTEPDHLSQLLVEWADRYALSVEAYHLMKSRGQNWGRMLEVPMMALQKFQLPKPSLEVYDEFMAWLKKLS